MRAWLCHISDLRHMPRPMKKPNETPDPIIAIGITMIDRICMAWYVPMTPPKPPPTSAPILKPVENSCVVWPPALNILANLRSKRVGGLYTVSFLMSVLSYWTSSIFLASSEISSTALLVCCSAKSLSLILSQCDY